MFVMVMFWVPFTNIDLIAAWISNHKPGKVWEEITYLSIL